MMDDEELRKHRYIITGDLALHGLSDEDARAIV